MSESFEEEEDMPEHFSPAMGGQVERESKTKGFIKTKSLKGGAQGYEAYEVKKKEKNYDVFCFAGKGFLYIFMM